MLRGSPNRVKQNRLAPRTIVEGRGSQLCGTGFGAFTQSRVILVGRPNSATGGENALLVTAPEITISPLCVMAPCDGPVCRYANR